MKHFAEVKKPVAVLLLSCLIPLGASAQDVIKGTVKDDTGQPVIGATVRVAGSTTGTVTDLDGNFTIDAPDKSKLQFSYVGYLPQTVTVDGKTFLNITMRVDNKTLNDVVVIGYGTQKKSVVTAAISKIGASELAKTSPVRVDNALKGLVSGVQVTQASGQPGAGSKIRIRGNGTINNSDPLYLVDGMPVGGIDYLNPSDIESIEVLKDAASCAVYGARAANGVVLVTTKKGKMGRTMVNYNFSFGWQNPWRERKELNAEEYTTLMTEAARYSGMSDDVIKAKLASFGSANTNWLHELYNHNAPVQNHEVSLSGASDKYNYYLSMGYYKSAGIVGGDYDRSNYERLTVRSNNIYKLFDVSNERSWLNTMKVGANIAYSRINSRSIDTENLTGSATGDAFFLSPLMPVYPDDEQALQDKYAQDIKAYGPLVRDKKTGRILNVPDKDFNEIGNPLAYLSLPGSKDNTDKMVANAFAELQIWDGLKFRSSYSIDLAHWGNDGWTMPYYYGFNAKSDQSKVWSTMNRSMTWQLENTMTYDKTFGKHTINVVLGQSAIKTTGRTLSGWAQDMVDYDGSKANIDFTIGKNVDGKRDVSGSAYSPHTLASYFGRLSYNYAERYMAQFTLRRDGSSRFGPSHKWATFPSYSLGWNITNEPFMKNRPDWLTTAKLRYSWGKNGNENIGDFAYTVNVATGNNYVLGGGDNQVIHIGSKPSGTPNADLKWEESEQWDLGLDMGFFNNALTMTVDWFKKKTNGMLKAMSVAAYLGESLPIGNVGDMENKGLELDLSYRFSIADVHFRVGTNWSYLKNKLVRLDNAGGTMTMDYVHLLGNVSRAEAGEPFPYFYGYKTAGIFQNQEQIDNYKNDKGELLQPKAKPGDVIFVDYNHDGVINDDDRTKIGKGDPDWTYGITFGADWRGFDFSMLWAGSIGNKIFDATRRLDLNYANLPHEYINRWHGEGTSNTMPRFTWANDNDNYRVSDLYVHNGNYLRLKNIQLGYTLPNELTRKFFVSNLRVFVQAENLITITPYKGFEPEISYDKSSGIDRGYYPQARTWSIGANISF